MNPNQHQMLGSSEDWGPPGSPEFPRSSKSGPHHPGTVPPPLARGTVAGDNCSPGHWAPPWEQVKSKKDISSQVKLRISPSDCNQDSVFLDLESPWTTHDGVWKIILEKNLCVLLLFMLPQQSISATVIVRDTPGQPSLHCILTRKKSQRWDRNWKHDSFFWLRTASTELHIRGSSQNHLNKTVFQMEKTAFIWHWCSEMLILHTFSAEVVSWLNQGEVIN